MGKCGAVAEHWDSCAVMAYLCHSGVGYMYLRIAAPLCGSFMVCCGVVVNLWDSYVGYIPIWNFIVCYCCSGLSLRFR